MVALPPDNPLYQEIFNGVNVPDLFESVFPRYSAIQAAFMNPSVRTIYENTLTLNARSTMDIQSGARVLLRDLVRYIGDGAPIGVPSQLLGGVQSVMRSLPVPSTLADPEIIKTVMNAADAAKAQDLSGLMIGTALGVLGLAVPVVGAIASAIVALATAIVTAVQSNKEDLLQETASQRALIYRTFPPPQNPDADIDSDNINNIVRPALRSHDWTSLWLPRYEGEWFGAGVDGGFLLTQRKGAKHPTTIQEWGEVPTYEREGDPTGGLGLIPGTTTITDQIQIGLPWNDDETLSGAWLTFRRGGFTYDPRGVDITGFPGHRRVIDTGRFYPSSARLAAAMIEWSLRPGNPYQYRLDTIRLHAAWKAWAEGGIEFIRKVCYPWFEKNWRARQFKNEGGPNDPATFIDPNTWPEGYFGTAAFSAVGAFACSREGLISNPPKYTPRPPPFGIVDLQDVKTYGQSGTQVWSKNSGGFLPILDPKKWPDQCMGDRYNRGVPYGIKDVLDGVAKTQRYHLWHSLAAAYARRNDAAFAADPKLADELMRARAALLQSEDRLYIDLADVPADEPGVPGIPGWESWIGQLQAAGVTTGDKLTPKKMKMGPTNEKPPERPPLEPGDPSPWPSPRPPRRGRDDPPPSSGPSAGVGALIGVAAGAGALVAAAALVRRGRKGRRR